MLHCRTFSNRALCHIVASATFVAVIAFTSSATAGWPLGQPARSRHVAPSYHGYYVAPTYQYMPRAYPYGNFGAHGHTPRTVYYDHNNNLRTWGPGH